MKKTIITIALFLLPMTALAETASIDWLGDQPHLNRNTTPPAGVRYDIVGQFVVTLTTEGEYRSYEVPTDAIGFDVFEDGSVSFTLGEPVTYVPQPIYDVEVLPVEDATTSANVYPL